MMKFANSKHTLTPNEVNKFVYCPYQWYYERLYGRKTLNELAKERNERLGREDKRLSFFNRGTEHHKSVYFYHSHFGKAAAAVLAAFAVILLLRVMKIV